MGLSKKEKIRLKEMIADLDTQIERLKIRRENYIEQLTLTDVVKSLPTKKIMHFDDWLKFLKWEQIGNSYVYKQGKRYKDANELKQAHNTYLKM